MEYRRLRKIQYKSYRDNLERMVNINKNRSTIDDSDESNVYRTRSIWNAWSIRINSTQQWATVKNPMYILSIESRINV